MKRRKPEYMADLIVGFTCLAAAVAVVLVAMGLTP